MARIPDIDLDAAEVQNIDGQRAVCIPAALQEHSRKQLDDAVQSHELVFIHYQENGKPFGREGIIESVTDDGGKVKIEFRAKLSNLRPL
jgi:hypothetical protein